MTSHTTVSGTKRPSSELSNAHDINENNEGRESTRDENRGKSTVDNTKTKTKINKTKTGKDKDVQGGPYKCLPIHGEHKRAVSCLAFAPTIRTSRNISGTGNGNGDIICASASADGSVRLWDITKYMKENDDHGDDHGDGDGDDRADDRAYGDAYGDADGDGDTDMMDHDNTNMDSSYVYDNSNNTRTRTGSSERINPVATITGHTRGINDLAWSPRAPNLIATASDDKTLRIWDVTRSSSASHDAGTGTGTGVPPGNTVGSPSVGTGNNLGDTEANNITDALVEFKGHTNFCFSTKFSPQGNLLVSGSFDETVKIWDVRTGECVSTLPAHSDPVTGVDFNTDGTCIVSSSHDGLMRVWDVATGECLKTIYAEGNPPVTFVKYSPNGKYVLSGMLDGRLRLWNVMGGADGNSFGSGRGNVVPDQEDPSNKTNNKPVLKDYLNIGLTCSQGRGGQCTKTYSGHKNSKYCIFSAFSVSNPERQSIVTGSEDGKVHVYDLHTRSERQVLDGHQDACLAVAVHDRKEIFASGGMSKDRLVKFWVPSDA
jgi:COMPASS component SWD3